MTLCTRLAGEPEFLLDRLIDELTGLTGGAGFNDDCSLVHLRFTGP